MERHWHTSFGTPHYAPQIPPCKTFVNAYVAVPEMQRAVVDALTGRQPFRGVSPVDAAQGLKGWDSGMKELSRVTRERGPAYGHSKSGVMSRRAGRSDGDL